MGQKILIIGGVAGGASTAAKLRRYSEADEIIMFERGPHVSFSNCSLPYHLSGVVKEAEDLVLMNPDLFLSQYNIIARTSHEVISIHRNEKFIIVKNLLTQELYEESYDKLVLSPGAAPIVPPIPGIDQIPVYTVRNVVDIDHLNQSIKKQTNPRIAIIGGGFIGIEVAENLKEAGYKVTLIEALDQILRPFDYDMVQIFHKELLDHGISLLLSEKVIGFETNKIKLSSGKEVDADIVVMAIGIAPEVTLAKDAGLTLGTTGAIKVNEQYQTNDPDIYAVGDAIEVFHGLTHSYTKLSLSGPALKQARSVAGHIHHQNTRNTGYIGSSAIKVFQYNGASTGLNEALIKIMNLDISYDVVRVILSDKVSLMPDSNPMHVKLLFETPSGKILGAQAIGKGDVTKRIDIIATTIKFGGTLEDLKDLELCYAPPFSTAKDIVNYVGYVGSNLLHGDFKQVSVDRVRTLVESGAYLIDVRESYEYKNGHIIGSINIPLSQLRSRISEIPQDQPVYLHCRTGQRSYNAVLALQNLGFTNVYNISGSFLGLSFFEYFMDQSQNRTPIVTAYNFN